MLRNVSLRLVGYLALGIVAAVLGCSSEPVTSSNPGNGVAPDGVSAAGSGSNGSAGSTSAAGTSAAGTTSTGTAGATTASSEFPCDVQQLLATKCQLCHKLSPPGTLLTSADFRRTSTADPSKTVGQLAIERLQATDTTRMPPAPLEAATPAEISALTNWVQGGAMAGSCDQAVAMAPDPYATPVVCSSMKNWTGGNRESPLMRPGGACISCHAKGGEGPLFSLAGTVYPSAHEPDDCNGVATAAGAQVVITEANGTAHTLSVNAAGNFYLETTGFAYPYQAKVVYQGRERVMVAAQKSGDCNDCHTEAGTHNAPGRIFLP
ncbi:MAG TPA: hypothetical protein VNG33_02250 [Polyangiaceae bacterium]|nr:hypothetical protein [Polyangiaceae bacterium]